MMAGDSRLLRLPAAFTYQHSGQQATIFGFVWKMAL